MIIPLESAKNYLKVEADVLAEDALITQMINAAFAYIEKETNIFVFARDVEYFIYGKDLRVYDAPINTTLPIAGFYAKQSPLYTTFFATVYPNDGNPPKLVLNVGYLDQTKVPSDLIMVAYEIIELLYEGKQLATDLSATSRAFLSANKRFIL